MFIYESVAQEECIDFGFEEQTGQASDNQPVIEEERYVPFIYDNEILTPL